MTELPITVCRVDTPEGAKDYVTCLSHDHVFKHGLLALKQAMAPIVGGGIS